jgi:hypothetical protein
MFGVIAWAASVGKDWIVTHAVALLFGLIGGYGAGRVRSTKSGDTED